MNSAGQDDRLRGSNPSGNPVPLSSVLNSVVVGVRIRLESVAVAVDEAIEVLLLLRQIRDWSSALGSLNCC